MEIRDKALATRLAPHTNGEGFAAELESIKALAATPEERAAIVRTLVDRVGAHLDQAPSEACGLGRVAHAPARSSLDDALRAECALTLAIAQNRLGEFGAALSLAEQAASFYAPRGENDQAARALCEAAWADSYIGNLAQAVDKITRAGARPLLVLPFARALRLGASIHIALSGQVPGGCGAS